jgi:hypothetical protein
MAQISLAFAQSILMMNSQAALDVLLARKKAQADVLKKLPMSLLHVLLALENLSHAPPKNGLMLFFFFPFFFSFLKKKKKKKKKSSVHCMVHPKGKPCHDCTKQYCEDDLNKCTGHLQTQEKLPLPPQEKPQPIHNPYWSPPVPAPGSTPTPPTPHANRHGQCSFKDAKLLQSNQFLSIWESCARQMFGSAKETENCIISDVGLSQPCAACFGIATHCSASLCLKECISGQDNQRCRACSYRRCGAALETCTTVEPLKNKHSIVRHHHDHTVQFCIVFFFNCLQKKKKKKKKIATSTIDQQSNLASAWLDAARVKFASQCRENHKTFFFFDSF